RHSLCVTGLEFSWDGRFLLSTCSVRTSTDTRDTHPLNRKGDDRKGMPDLKVWDLATGKEVLSLRPKDTSRILRNEGKVAAISPDGEVVAAAGFTDGDVRLYRVATGKEGRLLQRPARGVSFSPDGKRLVTGRESVKLWDATTGEEILTLGVPEWVESVCFSPDGSKIVASDRRAVRVWDTTRLTK